ncbi:MAG: choice-of-anchor tandem repeat GloVer-containing protein [Candidatus Sulfotelmatobacter sp.]
MLHSFGNGNDGSGPYASLIFDPSGNIYGTTVGGGAHAFGTVFELMPKSEGGWTEKLLHSFNDTGRDGCDPFASLVLDSAGNLYGTTEYCSPYGAGIVFELLPGTGEVWVEKVIHTFDYTDNYDGLYPDAGLVFDVAGNLYGTTVSGGYTDGGTVFELLPQANGLWKKVQLRNFGSGKYAGLGPRAGVIFDASGNLYGTTVEGGLYAEGTVFELTPAAGRNWTETILHDFGGGTDGAYLDGGLIFDPAGNLFGTTVVGGTFGEGTVFEVVH